LSFLCGGVRILDLFDEITTSRSGRVTPGLTLGTQHLPIARVALRVVLELGSRDVVKLVDTGGHLELGPREETHGSDTQRKA
jgi:hypothetical protein